MRQLIALTIIREREQNSTKLFCKLRRENDGDPPNYGAVLKGFLNGMQIVGDLSDHSAATLPAKFARDAGCLAAQLIAHLKQEAKDDLSLCPLRMSDDEADYVYTITVGKTLRVKVQSGGDKLYEGTLDNFKPEKYPYTGP